MKRECYRVNSFVRKNNTTLRRIKIEWTIIFSHDNGKYNSKNASCASISQDNSSFILSAPGASFCMSFPFTFFHKTRTWIHWRSEAELHEAMSLKLQATKISIIPYFLYYWLWVQVEHYVAWNSYFCLCSTCIYCIVFRGQKKYWRYSETAKLLIKFSDNFGYLWPYNRCNMCETPQVGYLRYSFQMFKNFQVSCIATAYNSPNWHRIEQVKRTKRRFVISLQINVVSKFEILSVIWCCTVI